MIVINVTVYDGSGSPTQATFEPTAAQAKLIDKAYHASIDTPTPYNTLAEFFADCLRMHAEEMEDEAR